MPTIILVAFYTTAELMAAWDISRQAIFNLADRHEWTGPFPGAYWAGPVEDYAEKAGRVLDREVRVLSGDN